MNATILSVRAAREGISILRLAPEAPFTYRAGQFVQIAFGDFPFRPYSIAAQPQGDGTLEIHIKDFGHGGASTYACREAKPGDAVRISGPYGSCAPGLAAANGPVLAVAGGLGITPLRAIVRDALANGHAGPVHLYWGTATVEGMYLKDEFEELEKESAGRFHFIPVIGKPVGEEAANTYPHSAAASIFLAGPPEMISATIGLMLQKGARRTRIHYDTHPEAGSGAKAKMS